MRTILRVIALSVSVACCLAGLAFAGADRQVSTESTPADQRHAEPATDGTATGDLTSGGWITSKGQLPVPLGDRGLEAVSFFDRARTQDADQGDPELVGCPVTILASNGSTSGNERAPNSNFLFGRAVYLVRSVDIAGGLANGAVPGSIGWHYSTAPGVTASGTLKVYLQNTTDTVNTKVASWATDIAPMTLVHNAATTLPNTTTPFDITFVGGSPFTYTGGSLYVAFDWQWGGPTTVATVVACTTTLTGGLLGDQNNTAPSATVTASNFRPETRLTPALGSANDAGVDLVISMGKLPNGLVGGQGFKAVVSNKGTSTQTNLPVSLNITGAQVFSDTQTIGSLAACGGSATVTFAAFTPSVNGNDTVTVSVPGDDNNLNNSKSKPLTVSPNEYSYKYPGTVADGGVGFTGGTGTFVGQFTTTGATQVDAVTVEFATVSQTTYRLIVLGDNGSGAPGATLYVDSLDRSVLASGAQTIRLPAPVAVGPGNFYVGIEQTNTFNASYSFDVENPLRAGRFFLSTLPPATWTDFTAPPPLTFKLNIGVVLGPCLVPLTVDVTPNSASVCEGGSVQLTCNTTGGTPPLTFQWTENGIDIVGATNSTFTASHSAGVFTYNCKVTDSGGCTNVQDATSSTVTFIANGGGCDDGNPCTIGDTCSGGVCQPGPNPCDDGDACTDDLCAGGCTHPPTNCNDNNVCTTDGCIPASGCSHSNNTLPCEDGNGCTSGDACSGGVCVPGASPAPVQFCNTSSIAINDGSAPTLATPYPASIPVSGVGAVLCSATVSLSGLGHTFPVDIDILLASPTGQNAIIMSDVGGGPSAATGINITFDDNAPQTIPEAGPLASGTFKPSNVNPGTGTETWPAPAPAPLGGSALSVFTGTNPIGAWKLFVVDDENLDSGTISNGWCLTVVAAPCSLNSQCNDGQACTTDTCQGGTCVNAGSSQQVTGLKIGTTCTGACTDKHTIVWDAQAGGTYDIMYGDLQLLHSAGLNASSQGCLGDNLPGANSDDGDSPGVDAGFWYMTRGRDCVNSTGTYDEGGNQQAPRDPLIPAGVDCNRP